MSIVRCMAAAMLAAMIAITAAAQQAEPDAQPDELQQLAELIGLTDRQQEQIRTLMRETAPEIQALQTQAHAVQQELQEQVRADFDEDEIRGLAERLGDLTGEMTAESVLLQSKIQAVFTEDQRRQLQDLVARQEEQQRQLEEQWRQRME
jgi:periplasmic protein CpxP/Spy